MWTGTTAANSMFALWPGDWLNFSTFKPATFGYGGQTEASKAGHIANTNVSTHPKRPTRPTQNEHKNEYKIERNNANASQNKKSCNPTHKSTRIAAHFILPNRTQRPTLLQFIRKQTTN